MKPRIVDRAHLQKSIAICETNQCGNWGTRDGRTGCLLLPKPCDIERRLLAGAGCVADPPQFGPHQPPGHAFAPKADARFVTARDFQQDILRLAGMVPNDIGLIVGVARSGMSVASMLAMYLHLPMAAIRQTQGDVVHVGNGWRLNESKHAIKKTRALVVDDTVMTGNSLKAIRPVMDREFPEATTAAVYVNPSANVKPDIHVVDLPWPHLLEWNLFNSVMSPNTACDFDGILCRDCSPEQDDDGERYLDFIRNAKPLYVPRKEPVPLIVTARIAKYRKPTEAWLRRHGMRWYKLVMHPAKTLAERNRDDIAAYKARHYSEWLETHTPNPAPAMFIESDDRQARAIARNAKRLVVCPSTAGVYT
ncbi:phosphoribosyltransferase [Stieleria neptunia]|uniref:phosphoribosyltransferase n=1 Tax=Stieleria neptunia TaxID=2527979 RepID=UPI001E4C9FF5|nr:phosphoribosyltransferase family protein [Stieleria neptunia]